MSERASGTWTDVALEYHCVETDLTCRRSPQHDSIELRTEWGRFEIAPDASPPYLIVLFQASIVEAVHLSFTCTYGQSGRATIAVRGELFELETRRSASANGRI